MARVLVIRFSALGDIILTLPAIDRLLSNGDEVHVLTKKSFLPLFEAHGGVRHLHSISDHASLSELIQKISELNKLNFEVIYDLHRNLRSLLVGSLLRGKVLRISKYRLKELILYIFRKRFYRILKLPQINRALGALKIVGGQSLEETNRLRNLKPLADEIARWSDGNRSGYVCIAVESVWRQKEWPEQRFIEVARLIGKLGLGVVWIGLRQLSSAAAIENALDLTGKQSLGEVATTISNAKLVLCNDTGLMHLAEAAGVPVVAVFGPTTRELGFAPRLGMSKIVEADLWCRPCSKTGRWCIRPVHRRKCLTEVSVEQVYRTVEASLGTKHRRSTDELGQRP